MTVDQYNKCVDLHGDAIYRFVLKNIKDKDEAKDIVQDCFEKVWMKIDDVSFEKAKSYFFTAAYHIMIDKLRRNKFSVSLEQAPEIRVPSSSMKMDLKSVINNALERLPDVQRIVVMLRDYEGYSYEEIGEIAGLTESQVKVYIYRARMTMKEYIVKLENVI
ncbi:MAG: RNA polymerase sigma factor [Bacteroidota bacterium]